MRLVHFKNALFLFLAVESLTACSKLDAEAIQQPGKTIVPTDAWVWKGESETLEAQLLGTCEIEQANGIYAFKQSWNNFDVLVYPGVNDEDPNKGDHLLIGRFQMRPYLVKSDGSDPRLFDCPFNYSLMYSMTLDDASKFLYLGTDAGIYKVDLKTNKLFKLASAPENFGARIESLALSADRQVLTYFENGCVDEDDPIVIGMIDVVQNKRYRYPLDSMAVDGKKVYCVQALAFANNQLFATINHKYVNGPFRKYVTLDINTGTYIEIPYKAGDQHGDVAGVSKNGKDVFLFEPVLRQVGSLDGWPIFQKTSTNILKFSAGTALGNLFNSSANAVLNSQTSLYRAYIGPDDSYMLFMGVDDLGNYQLDFGVYRFDLNTKSLTKLYSSPAD
jgi:hypothetical protein